MNEQNVDADALAYNVEQLCAEGYSVTLGDTVRALAAERDAALAEVERTKRYADSTDTLIGILRMNLRRAEETLLARAALRGGEGSDV